ncbi:3369_t:CDS:2 [Dentiscutata erythropus]|uniref:JmjC domain-containing histone demethylation protein 1 n=1 Tax=Dentiscutata erythropus TaxID=1348616 RepID=A0A9N9A645_9GLOM|nr:3369_t:CDS:2 [Dentiscutata erythropus]
MSSTQAEAPQAENCPLCDNKPRFMPLWFQENTETWIKCDICLVWCHAACLKLPSEECERIDEYHCPKCAISHGPSTLRKSLREHSRINYADLENGLTGNPYKWKRVLDSKLFVKPKFPKVRGDQLTLDWVRTFGLDEPILIDNPDGLDMKMPSKDITVSYIAATVGYDTPVDVIEQPSWNLYQWANYFDGPKRDQVLNVISLEISGTPLGDSIVRPRIVRELDWCENVWPKELKAFEYPKVQLYCLMSIKDSFTDFHIDFGGTSVFYHVIKGSKIFYFVRPTPPNLKKYSRWISSPEQSMTFFADLVKDCYEVRICAVIGGNFLHGYNIGGQLAIYEIEKRVDVPIKYRFPYFEKICWYAGKKYYRILKENPDSLSQREEKGLVELALFLSKLSSKLERNSKVSSEERHSIKENIPTEVRDPAKLSRRLSRRINKHITRNNEEIDAQLDSTNNYELHEVYANERSGSSPEFRLNTPTKIRLKIVSRKRNIEDINIEDSEDNKGVNEMANNMTDSSNEHQAKRILLTSQTNDTEGLFGDKRDGSPLTPQSGSTISWHEEDKHLEKL